MAEAKPEPEHAAGDAPGQQRPARGRRIFSALELLVVADVVIGHNVFRMLPNEVPILVVMALVSVWLRKDGWSSIGFKRPDSWLRTWKFAIAAAVLRILLGEFVIDPLTSRFWPPAVPPSAAESITGNLGVAILALLFVWTFAALGEEISYRGYVMARAADVAGGSTAAWTVAMFLSAVLFGIGHWYKGPAGIIDSGVAGLILAATYLLSGRNLWACILAHGLIDTYAVVVVYAGWMT